MIFVNRKPFEVALVTGAVGAVGGVGYLTVSVPTTAIAGGVAVMLGSIALVLRNENSRH